MPSLMNELNGTIGKLTGETFSRLQMKAYNLDDELEMANFLIGNSERVNVPGTTRMVNYESAKRIGIAVSKLGASKAIALGAYAYALNHFDSKLS